MSVILERVLALWRETERDLDRNRDHSARPEIEAEMARLRWLFQAITGDVRANRRRRSGDGDLEIIEAIASRQSARLEPRLAERPLLSEADLEWVDAGDGASPDQMESGSAGLTIAAG